MTNYENEYFQKTKFAPEQVLQFLASAEKDLGIAQNSEIAEVVFKFSYDALIKIGIALIAKDGYKVRSQTGHHFRIIEKLSQILANEDIVIIGNKMRRERNIDLYSGGSSISEKDNNEYRSFVLNNLHKAKVSLE
jgi:hypothetical protein